jgi:hypothetical protein
MVRFMLIAGILSLPSCNPQKPAADSRAEYWQKELSRERVIYGDAVGSVLDSMTAFSDKAVAVEFVSKPDEKGILGRSWLLRFVHDKKVVVEFSTAPHIGFVALDGVVFVTNYSSSSSGCTVIAFDLTTGKELWKTHCTALRDPAHLGYENATTIGLRPATNKPGETGSVIAIQGDESFGRYTEILDPKTGHQLAHQIYKPKPKEPE